MGLMTVISAGQLLCGRELHQPGSPKVTPVHCSGVYFHFLPPFGARALRFCLLLKNPAPTLSPTNPQRARSFVESLQTAVKIPRRGGGQFSKAGRGEGWSAQTSKCFRKGGGRHGIPPGGPREEWPSFLRQMSDLHSFKGGPGDSRISASLLGGCSAPSVLLFFLNASYEHLDFILFFKYLLSVFGCSGLHSIM